MTRGNKLYDLSLELRDGYGYAYVAGEQDNLAISSAYWKEIGEFLKDNGLDKVLVVEDIEQQAAMTDVFDLVTALGGFGFYGVRIAFVDRYLSHQDLNDFAVLVGTNRGLDGKAFGDEEVALKWLLSD